MEILSRMRLAGEGSSRLIKEMVQPAQSCPSSQMTEGFLAADSRAAVTFSTLNRSASPTAAAALPQSFKKSRLDNPLKTLAIVPPSFSGNSDLLFYLVPFLDCRLSQTAHPLSTPKATMPYQKKRNKVHSVNIFL